MTSDHALFSRRRLLGAASAAALLAGCGTRPQPRPMAFGDGQVPPPVSDEALLDELEARTFRFFWDTAHPVTGLVPDRWPAAPDMASIASVGFGLTAYLVGVERGLVTRAQAAERVRMTLGFLASVPQGEAETGMAGHRGFFYHFLDMATGTRFTPQVELSTIDTALLMGGVLAAQSYFQADDPGEARIRALAESLYTRVDWAWAQRRGGYICMGWEPGRGFERFIDYHGYDEAMLLYLLALGSPTHPARDDSWTAFCAGYPRTWGTFMGQTHLGGAPLFWHQYSHVWVDFRGIQDEFMRGKGLDYFENSRRATLSQRAYAAANPAGWNDYGTDVWGLTACDGPAAPAWRTRATTARSRRPRPRPRCPSHPRRCWPPSTPCGSASAPTSTAATGFWTPSTPVGATTRPGRPTAASCPASAGSTPTTSASTKARSWR
jgi:hypothetical protein